MKIRNLFKSNLLKRANGSKKESPDIYFKLMSISSKLSYTELDEITGLLPFVKRDTVIHEVPYNSTS
jgi:hypothetical protein